MAKSRNNAGYYFPDNPAVPKGAKIVGIKKPGVVCHQCKGEYWECGTCRGTGYTVQPEYVIEMPAKKNPIARRNWSEAPLFYNDPYWGTWSRILSYSAGTTVELNLTPVNPTQPGTWESQVAGFRIRKHQTPRDVRKFSNTLPERVKESMLGHLDADLVLHLLNTPDREILGQIDWDKYQKVCNGGANLADIQKGPLERLARAHKNAGLLAPGAHSDKDNLGFALIPSEAEAQTYLELLSDALTPANHRLALKKLKEHPELDSLRSRWSYLRSWLSGGTSFGSVALTKVAMRIDARRPEEYRIFPAVHKNPRSISAIAREISRDWNPISPAARPYLQALYSLDSIDDEYGVSSGKSIVAHFLSNASTWRGDTARRIKAELNGMLKPSRV